VLAAIPHPNIPTLEIGPLDLHPFGFLVGVAIITGTIMADRRARATGLDPRVVSEAALWAVIPGFIGAHLVAVLFYTPEKVLEDPVILLKLWDGISSFGGFLGGAAGVIWYLRRNKIPFWAYADTIAFGFTFAWIFGRMGCTVAFDHPGSETDFALAMPYTGKALSHAIRHNLGFYEMIWALVMSGFFWSVRKKARPAGWYLSVWLIAYTPLRFAADFLRRSDVTYLGLTPGQYIAIGLFGTAIWMLRTRLKADEMLGIRAEGEHHVFADGRPGRGADSPLGAMPGEALATAGAGGGKGPSISSKKSSNKNKKKKKKKR